MLAVPPGFEPLNHPDRVDGERSRRVKVDRREYVPVCAHMSDAAGYWDCYGRGVADVTPEAALKNAFGWCRYDGHGPGDEMLSDPLTNPGTRSRPRQRRRGTGTKSAPAANRTR